MQSTIKQDSYSISLLTGAFLIYAFFQSPLFLHEYIGWHHMNYSLDYHYSALGGDHYLFGRAHFLILLRWIRGVFHPVVAQVLLSAGLLLLGGLGLYLFLKERFHSNTAFLTTLIFLFFPLITYHGSGANYPAVFAGSCFLWSLVFFQRANFQRASFKKQAFLYVLSGFLFISSFMAFINYFIFFPLFFLLHWEDKASFKEAFKRLKIPLLYMSIGTACFILFVGWVNFFLYERSFLFPWIFIKPFLLTLIHYDDTHQAFWRLKKVNLFTLDYMHFHFLMLVLSLLWIFHVLRKKKPYTELFLPFFYFYVFLIYGIVELILLHGSFRHANIAQPLFYVAFLWIGFLLSRLLSKKDFSFLEKLIFTGIVFFPSVIVNRVFDAKKIKTFIDSEWFSLVLFSLVAIGIVLVLSYSFSRFRLFLREWISWKEMISLSLIILFFGFYREWTVASVWLMPIALSWVFLLFGKKHWIKVSSFIVLFGMGISVTALHYQTTSSFKKNLLLAHLELYDYLKSILTEEEKKNVPFFPILMVSEDLPFRQRFSLLNKPFKKYYGSIDSFLQEENLRKSHSFIKYLILLKNSQKRDFYNALIENYKEKYKGSEIEFKEIANYPVRRGEVEFDVSILQFQKH